MSEEKIPKVSVCVVTYNQEKYIRQCLQSIVDQETDFYFEVIVGDDCSIDGTRAIVQEFSEKYSCIIPILRKENIGAFKNYIAIHNMARGEYIAHIDGDDYWYPEKISYQARFLDEHPNVSAIFTNAICNGVVKYTHNECGFHRIEDILQKIFTRNLCVHSSILERRKPISTDIENESELLDFEIYWEKHGNALVYIDSIVRVNYTVSESGISRQENFIELVAKTVPRFNKKGLDANILETMKFDLEFMKYLFSPYTTTHPSIIVAIKKRYSISMLSRLVIPKKIYLGMKFLKNFKISM